jgi:3-hydroxypropionyl-coenzyme A dehydratase
MSDNYILGEKKGSIYYITLNRPEKRNAITFEMLIEISERLEEVVTDPEVRAIIVKGEGKVFSAGVDFASLGMLVTRFMADTAAGGATIRADIQKFQQYLNRLEVIEIPIICAIHERIYGMAVEFVLACDIRLMSDDCLWGMQELQIGVIPDLGGTARLAKLLGQQRAMEILMAGRMYDAKTALDWGLVNHIYPKEELLNEAEKLALDIAKSSPIAVGAVKKIAKQGEGINLMTQLDMEVNLQSQILRTEDFKEGVQAKLERRDPNWKRR